MSLWQKWVALLDRREPATSLALTRIAVGSVVTLHVIRALYRGVSEWVWVDAQYGGIRTLKPGWLEWFGGLTPTNIHVVAGLSILSSFCMALGLGTRVATLGTWFFYGCLADLNSHAGGSYDELLKNIIFLLLLSDCGASLSLDQRLRPRSEIVPAWPRYLLITQLCIVYFMTGVQKVSSSWVPFGDSDALWYILQQPTWQRFALPTAEMVPLYPMMKISTFLVWLWEWSGPLLLLSFYFRYTHDQPGRLRAIFNRYDFRKWYLLFGLGMHLGIESLMEVGPFSFATTSIYLACIHPDEWRAFARRRGWIRD